MEKVDAKMDLSKDRALEERRKSNNFDCEIVLTEILFSDSGEIFSLKVFLKLVEYCKHLVNYQSMKSSTISQRVSFFCVMYFCSDVYA